MDIIAYGAASKEKRRAEELATLLGPDVKGGKESLQGRLDTLMDSMDDVTRLADRVIVRDAVNLMKAEARLNTVVQAKKYGMDHMVFDDLLDLSGIDTLKSTGYTHDAVKGEIVALQSCEIFLKEELDTNSKKAMLIVDEKGSKLYKSIIPPMTASNKPSPYIVTSATDSNTSYYLFDETATTWTSTPLYSYSNGENSWVKIDLGVGRMKMVEKYSFKANNVNSNLESPKKWKLEASDTGSFSGEQTVIDSKSNVLPMRGDEVVEYSIDIQEPFRYYRFVFLDATGDSRGVRLKEIKLYESYESNESASAMISKDSGNEWEIFEIEKMNELSVEEAHSEKIILKILVPESGVLLNYGLIWT